MEEFFFHSGHRFPKEEFYIQSHILMFFWSCAYCSNSEVRTHTYGTDEGENDFSRLAPLPTEFLASQVCEILCDE